ncbi:Glycosyl transferase [Luteimonas sp. 9C]|uniref:glycosyltransferase n=1 Tax=Luteimonas sp. 9C TaxID=2653148 RepID=UPI0012F201AB|nr:glycosyltransferase [Luteimonas sp. 9C]VXB15575.1 Glycosyl transferase [Luteimonas sp. 9C]
MIGVVIPAHNEEAGIAACLASVQAAARHAALAGEAVEIVVALDRCSDRTAEIVAGCGVRGVALHDGNVGRARAAGAACAIGLGARWVACTDADSRVPQDWLACQIACDADAFCGIVTVDDWLDYDETVRLQFGTPDAQRDGHPHVHGANMGFSAAMYLRCGGFAPLSAHEDVAMVDALQRAGARIARRATPVVITSARRVARAQGGFADYLLALEARTRAVVSPLLETPVADFDLGSGPHAA